MMPSVPSRIRGVIHSGQGDPQLFSGSEYNANVCVVWQVARLGDPGCLVLGLRGLSDEMLFKSAREADRDPCGQANLN